MALLSLRCLFGLLTVLIILHSVLLLIYFSPDIRSSRDVMTDNFQQLRCAKLQKKFSVLKPASSIKLKSFTRELSEFLSCPHKPNKTERYINRLKLHFHCNATGTLCLTKRNTAVNQTISYEGRKSTYNITEELHKMLPEDLPWSARALGRCAVVGSSGILKKSRCGREIDSSDFVIRFNLASVNNSDVGLKTDLITINPSQLRKYKNLEENPDPLVKRVSVYGNATLIIPAFAYTVCTAPSITALKVLHPIRQQQTVFFSADYLGELNRYWKGRGLQERRLSTGFMLINTALELCEHVHVYGFWPFDTDLHGKPIPYHYYDKVKASRVMHKMPEEFVRLLQLHSQGALTLHLHHCVSDS